MNLKMKFFSYNLADTFIHRLSGLTKLLCFLFLTFAVMSFLGRMYGRKPA